MSAHDSDNLPPELLAAYVDGELTPLECRRVETWLAEHPEARADVEDQRRLLRLFDETAPPVPGEDRWADALAGVERELIAPPVRRLARARRAALAVAVLAAAAAVVLVVLALRKPPAQHGGPADQPQVTAEEEWPVVSADEIDIVSMDDRDRGALVVGEPPVNGPLELLSTDEVQVNKLPDWQGRVGRLPSSREPGTPVIMSLGTDEDP